jgi:hypothetical protein
LFNNWINSDLIYVNDILDENGEISHNFILNHLNNKSNWITEFTTTVFRFTLSGLLFQINLKHLLSISFLYFSGTTQALATYVNIGTIKDLTLP